MLLKIGILGATGRMGQEVASLLHTGQQIGGDTLEFSEAVAQSKKVTSVDGVPVKIIGVDRLDPVHVWIDFSRPEATLRLLELTKAPIVVCTTGFTSAQFEQLELASKVRPLLIAPNTSPGIHFVLSILEGLPSLTEIGFDVILEETHHTQKVDKPSGTAKRIEQVLEARGNKPKETYSIRAGGEKGRHRITFAGKEEELVIEHRVFDRALFAKGALSAAQFLVHQEPGFYSMKDVWRNTNV